MKKIAGKKKLKMKTAILILIPIGAIIALVSVLAGAISHQGDNIYVARINGEPISVREFKQILIKNRAGIYDYFKQKYGVEDSLTFWSTSCDGEVPGEIAKKKAMDECVRIKIQQILAKQKGLIHDISYTAFLKDLDTENRRRKNAVENKEAVYGPVQYTESEYFDYVLSNMIIKLKVKMIDEELSVSDKDLRDYYESVKDKLYKKENYIKIQKIFISFLDKNGNINNSNKQKAKAIMEQLGKRLKDGEAFEELINYFGMDVTLQEQVFDESTARMDSRVNSGIKEAAEKLAAGETSEVIEDNGAFNIIKCIDKKDSGYKPFEECEENVKSKYRDKKYEELIDSLTSEAKLEINEKIYGKIQPE